MAGACLSGAGKAGRSRCGQLSAACSPSPPAPAGPPGRPHSAGCRAAGRGWHRQRPGGGRAGPPCTCTAVTWQTCAAAPVADAWPGQPRCSQSPALLTPRLSVCCCCPTAGRQRRQLGRRQAPQWPAPARQQRAGGQPGGGSRCACRQARAGRPLHEPAAALSQRGRHERRQDQEAVHARAARH